MDKWIHPTFSSPKKWDKRDYVDLFLFLQSKVQNYIFHNY